MTGAKHQVDMLAAEAFEAVVAREPGAALAAGRKVARFKRGDLAEAEAAAAEAATLRDRLDTLDLAGLDRTERLTAAYLRHWFETQAEQPKRWWTGFGIAPYSISGLLLPARQLLGSIDVTDKREAERFLAHAEEVAEAVEALRERVIAQAANGWRLPKPALANARRSLEGAAAMVGAAVVPAAARRASAAIRAAAEAIASGQVAPAFRRLLDTVDASYEAAAPAEPGMAHQPGGADAYRGWIRYQLGYDADPAEIHRIGLAEVARLAAAMAQVRAQRFGHDGDEAGFHAKLRLDPGARAPSAEALEATYNRHLGRMEPAFANMFNAPPKSRATVERLPPELEAGMTFGYYSPAALPGADSTYFFSGKGIPDRIQINAAALIFHELVPGHHVQVMRQKENDALPEARRTLHISTTFSEGWAEYASSLGEEAGLFDDPYDQYGYLAHQRFIAQRLVVDTGLNALGWSLEQAEAYMSANTLENPDQVRSELLRYTTDMPAQALCYAMGYRAFHNLRTKAEAKLGARFDLAGFHEAILDQGNLPIPVLEESIGAWIGEVVHPTGFEPVAPRLGI